MNRSLLETITGAFVLGVAAWFLFFFLEHNTGISVNGDYYSLQAKFNNADGVSVGTPVRISGIKVGVITSERIDLNSYMAVVNFSINKNIKVPSDSIAKISSEGLIGGKYLELVPGGDDSMLPSGGEIQYTQSSVNLETLIGKMIFSKDSKSDKNSAESK